MKFLSPPNISDRHAGKMLSWEVKQCLETSDKITSMWTERSAGLLMVVAFSLTTEVAGDVF